MPLAESARTSPVIVVEKSTNNKLSAPRGKGMSATYVSQASCPDACALRKAGCYAETGFVGIHTNQLNRLQVSMKATRTELAIAEASGIAGLTGERRLRLHIVGDCATPTSANIVGGAMMEHERKHGQRAWTYTHSWRSIRRSTWGGTARVLASCDRIDDLPLAEKQGYSSALIIPRTESRKSYLVITNDHFKAYRVVPCPAQFLTPTGERQTYCERCNICSDTERNFKERRVVGFQPDGQSHPFEQTPYLEFGDPS